MSTPIKPLFDGKMVYCARCCMPETERGTNIDEFGICRACQNSEQKMHIDWREREERLHNIFRQVIKKSGDNYHCIIPVSGGKDSTFQIYMLTRKYGLYPLAVTFCQNWHSESGWYNLQNMLETFNVDHMMFTPARSVVNRTIRRSLSMIGDPCWQCHAGLGAFPLQVAVKFDLPLLVYGEPASEGHALGSYDKPLKFDREYSIKVSARVRNSEFACDYLPEKDLSPFVFPSQHEYDDREVLQIHLGSYHFWDDERQTEFVRDHFGWRETEMEPSYKRYKCVECIMPGLHDFTLYLKRGYGRATYQANMDVRQGLLTREEGFFLTHKYDCRKPEVMDYALKEAGLTKQDLYAIMEKHRKPVLCGVHFPVSQREKPNEERLIPFNLQIIEKCRKGSTANCCSFAGTGKAWGQVDKPCCLCCHLPSDELDDGGICPQCSALKQCNARDWVAKEGILRAMLSKASEAGNWWDCVVPVTGTAQSLFLLHVLRHEYSVKPLAVVFNHNWFTEIGWYNLQNALEVFDVDSIMYTPNRDLIARVAAKSLQKLGHPAWHWYAGYAALPIKVAAKYKIPLVIYVEPDVPRLLPQDSASECLDPKAPVKALARILPHQMIGENITPKDMIMFQPVSKEEVSQVGLRAAHLFDFIRPDIERIREFVSARYYWRGHDEQSPILEGGNPGAIIPGMHDFACQLDNGPDALNYLAEITGFGMDSILAALKRHGKGDFISPRSGSVPIPFARQVIERLRPQQNDPYHIENFARAELPNIPRRRHIESFLDVSIDHILELYRSGELSPVDVAKISIDQYNRYEPLVHAWEVFDPEILLTQARESEKRIKQGRCRHLEGVPLAVKDIFNTEDFPTQMGSPLWKDFTPGNDARAVFRMKEMGCVIPGKTVTAEFAVHALGKTLNPHNPAHNPGTSSSGSAAAVAVGMVPAALGSQTAASISRPASFCGVYGMKPSFGLIPRTGILKTTDSLDTIGFISVFYKDLIRLFEAIRVRGRNYPLSHAALSDPQRQRKPVERPWRVALVRTHTWEYAADYAKKDLLAWAGKMAASEVEIVEAELPPSMRRAHEVHSTIYDKTLSYYFREEYKRAELVSPIMNEIIEHGQQIPVALYHKALREQEDLARDMDEFLKEFDIIVSLGTAGEAPLRESKESPDPGLMWTLTHLPVISAPVFTSPSGLPFGVQLVSRKYNDYLLFRFADFLHERELLPVGPNPLP